MYLDNYLLASIDFLHFNGLPTYYSLPGGNIYNVQYMPDARKLSEAATALGTHCSDHLVPAKRHIQRSYLISKQNEVLRHIILLN